MDGVTYTKLAGLLLGVALGWLLHGLTNAAPKQCRWCAKAHDKQEHEHWMAQFPE